MQETNGYPDKRPDGPEGRWERDVLRDVLLAAYKEQRRARFWRNFWWVIGVLLFAALWFGSDDGTAGQGLAAGKEHTAVMIEIVVKDGVVSVSFTKDVSISVLSAFKMVIAGTAVQIIVTNVGI